MEMKNTIEGLKCISCGEYNLAILNFSGKSSKSNNQNQFTEQQTSFFENLDDILEQNRIDTPTRWSFTCFLSRFGIFKGKEDIHVSNFQIDSAINEFEKISKKDRLLKNLKLFLFGQNVEIPNIRSDKLALEFSREILYVASHYGSLYRTLQLLFKPLLSEITDIRLFKLLGYSAFQLYTPAPPKEFWSIRLLTTNEQYRDIIYYSQDLPFLSALQADYINHFQYPAEFPGSLTFNSSSCSLLMTSILKNVHFVDLLSQLIKEKIHKLEIGLIPEIARVAPSFVPILFAAYQPFLYLSPQVFLRLIIAKLPAINNPENNFCYKNNKFSENIIELQQRFINDLHFTKLVVDLNNENFNNINNDPNINPKKPEKKKSFFGKKKKVDDSSSNINNIIKPKVRRDSDLGLFIRDFGCPVNEILKNHSIPFLCNGHFRRSEFMEFETKKFYIFSDKEATTDFDFIHIYNAITDTIELLQTSRIQNPNIVQIQRTLLGSIEKNLQSIREPNQLTKVAIDIFSLIFLKEDQNENSNFLCQNLGISYLIIQILKKFFSDDRYIKYGSFLLSHYASLMTRKRIFSISTAMKSNLNFLLDIIIKHNWTDAREVALLLSGKQGTKTDPRSKIYWRAYLLSYGVHMLITGKSCNIECEEFKDDLNLEISLSSSMYRNDDCIDYALSQNEKNDKKLTLIEKVRKIRENRKKIEVEDNFSPLRDSYWIDVGPAAVNLEMFPFDFFTNKLIERYANSLKKSKSLLEFANFLNVYFNCTYSSSDKNNHSFVFEPIRALSTAFNKGKIELAEKMASILKIDLFELAMKNQREFKFNSNVVDHFGSKHPLECVEILYFLNKNKQIQSENITKFITTNEKYEKIFNYLNSDKTNDSQTTLEEPIEVKFIDLLKSTKENNQIDQNELFKQFDDYLYKLNHSRVAQIVISNFDNINKDVAIYLLRIVDYTIDTNSLNDEIKKLLLQKEIEKIINSNELTEKDQIIDNLIENDHFNLATKFINLNYQTQKEKDEIIIKIASKLITSSNLIKFISCFENQNYIYELIASKIQDKISILIEIAPMSISPILAAFSSLPESIRSDSSLVDKSTISKQICNQIRENKNTDVIFSLNENHLILFNDENLVSIVEELADCCTDIQTYINCSSYLTSIVTDKNKEIFIDTNSRRVTKEIELILINSIEAEFEAFLIISKLIRFNRICKLDDKVSNVLNAFYLLLIESPFYFTQKSFSIKNDKINLFEILSKLDLDSVACLLPKETFDHFNYTKQKVEIMLNLGRFDDALHILNVNKQYVYEMDELFLCPFLYKQFYHSNLIPLIVNLCSNVDQFFSKINTISDSESDLFISVNSTLSNLLNYKEFASDCKTNVSKLPFLSFCSDFCERFSTKDSFFRFCIRRGAMTTVVSKFMTIEENENFNYDINNSSQELFIKTIVECSIEYDKLQLLKKEMNDFSKSNSKNNSTVYWKYLINFCEKREMGFLMLETSEFLSLKDKIAISYIEIFGEIDQKDISKKIKYLDKARLALKECIEIQQPIIDTKSNSKEKETSFKSGKNRRTRSTPNTHPESDAVTDYSYSQQSSTILFDPDEFNSRNPDEYCEYDNCSGSNEDEKIHRSSSAKKNKNRNHLGFTDLLVIADLLSQFLPFFLEKNEPFPDAMNLFNGSLACLALGGFFLRKGRFDLLQKISEVMKVPQKAIVNAFFEFITQYKDLKLNHSVIPNENQNNIDDNSNLIQDTINNITEKTNNFENSDGNTKVGEDSNENEIIQFIEDTKNEVNFWTSNNNYYVHLYVNKLSFSKNFKLIPIVIEKLLPPEKEPEMLLEFDFLNQAFKIAKEKSVANDLLPSIASRASNLGDYEMVKKCEDELGIKTEKNLEIENNE